jgi:hypothetical protein
LQILTGGTEDGLAVRLRPDLASYDTISTKLNTSTPLAFGVRRNSSTTLELRVNGRLNGRVNSAEVDVNISAVGADVVLGGGADETPACCPLFGGIAELVAVRGALADEDLGRLEAYLTAKYALP